MYRKNNLISLIYFNLRPNEWLRFRDKVTKDTGIAISTFYSYKSNRVKEPDKITEKVKAIVRCEFADFFILSK